VIHGLQNKPEDRKLKIEVLKKGGGGGRGEGRGEGREAKAEAKIKE
jgi:hypothetical protein